MGTFALITFSLSIWNERRVENPLLNLRSLKTQNFPPIIWLYFFNYISMYMVLFIMPFYLQKVLHLQLNVIGFLLTIAPVTMMFFAPFSGLLSDKFGSRYLAFSGALIFATALYSMSQLTIFSDAYDVLWRFALLGMGAAFFQAPNNRSIMANISRKESGMASSIIVTMRNLGMVFAVSFAGLLLYTTIAPSTLQSPLLFNLAAYDFTTGMHRIVIFGAILSVIMAILSLVKIHSGRVAVNYFKNKLVNERII